MVRVLGLGRSEGNELAVVRLRRAGRPGAGWRTLLLMRVRASGYGDALRWAAATRDALTEPEASDLYLLLGGEGIADQDPEVIEGDEYFCRKMVARTEDDPPDLVLEGTFLAREPEATKADGTAVLADPLAMALETLRQDGLLNEAQKQTWREALTATLARAELAQELHESLHPTARAE